MEGDFTPKSKLNLLIIDDQVLFREGLLLMFRIYEEASGAGAGHQELLTAIEQYKSDVVIIGLSVRDSLSCSAIQTLFNDARTFVF